MLVIMAAGYGRLDNWVAEKVPPPGHQMTLRQSLTSVLDGIFLRIAIPSCVLSLSVGFFTQPTAMMLTGLTHPLRAQILLGLKAIPQDARGGRSSGIRLAREGRPAHLHRILGTRGK